MTLKITKVSKTETTLEITRSVGRTIEHTIYWEKGGKVHKDTWIGPETEVHNHSVTIEGIDDLDNVWAETSYVDDLQQSESERLLGVIEGEEEEPPIGSIRRLLNWARCSIEGKGKPYTDSDGANDIAAVEEWTTKFIRTHESHE